MMKIFDSKKLGDRSLLLDPDSGRLVIPDDCVTIVPDELIVSVTIDPFRFAHAAAPDLLSLYLAQLGDA